MMNYKLNTTTTNLGSASSRQNPFFFLTTTFEYLASCAKALAREYELPDEEAPVKVIIMAPDLVPEVEYSDRVDLLNDKDRSDIIEEHYTGLMLTCPEGQLLVDDDGFLLVSTAVLFKCEDGVLCSVSPQDLRQARDLYIQGLDMIEMGCVKVPAIRISMEGGAVT